MTPKNISTKSSYPKKIFIFLKTQKIIEIQNFEPKKNGPSLRICENIRVNPLGIWPSGSGGDVVFAVLFGGAEPVRQFGRMYKENYFEFEPVVQEEMSFQHSSYLELWWQSW